ncbi:MAG TPA: hypothetical protein VNU71_19335 [Burkholderiaceae bacterium]|nr:hypothetical protein [Burkholderiaceae bacterium]
MRRSLRVRQATVAAVLALMLASAQAQSRVSEVSALSALPVAVSVAGTGLLLSAGTTLVIVGVEASAAGTVCVLERASDGARASVRFAGNAAGALSLAAGTAVVVTAVSAGWVLSAAGQAIAFVPNQIGAALLYNERITR